MNTYYRDFDNDGYGDPNTTIKACSPPGGYISVAGDCCDKDSNAKPHSTWCSTTQTMCNVGSYDYDCDGFSTPVTCCQCDPAPATYCTDGWQAADNLCTPNTITTGSVVDCGTTVSCSPTSNNGCTGFTVSGGSGSTGCANATQWLSTTACGALTVITYFDCGLYPACPAIALGDQTGYNQGCH